MTPDAIVTSLLTGSALAAALKVAAVVAGFGLGVRLLAVGGGTADDRDRVLVDAARGRRPAPARSPASSTGRPAAGSAG